MRPLVGFHHFFDLRVVNRWPTGPPAAVATALWLPRKQSQPNCVHLVQSNAKVKGTEGPGKVALAAAICHFRWKVEMQFQTRISIQRKEAFQTNDY